MVYSIADLDQPLVDAMEANKPIALSRNAIVNNLHPDSQWNDFELSPGDAGETTGVNITDFDYPLVGLYDGNLLRGSRPLTATQNSSFLVLRFVTPIAFDSIFLKVIGLKDDVVNINVDVADDGAFSSNLREIAQWRGLPGGNNSPRMVALRLRDPNNPPLPRKLSGVEYLRVRISMDSGQHDGNIPHVTQLVIGERRQWARSFLRPIDQHRRASKVDLYESEFLFRQAYTRAKGFSDLQGRILTAETDRFDLTDKDEQVIRDMFEDIGFGCSTFPFVNQPEKESYEIRMSRFAETLLNLQNVSGDKHREQDVMLWEDPPFMTSESVFTNPTITTVSLPAAQEGVAYAEEIQTADGANDGFAIVQLAPDSPALPAPLSIQYFGPWFRVQGTPAGGTAGVYQIKFRARDISNRFTDKVIPLTVNP